MRRILPLIAAFTLLSIGCGRLVSDVPGAGGDPVDQRKIDVYEAAIRSLAGTEGWFDPV